MPKFYICFCKAIKSCCKYQDFFTNLTEVKIRRLFIILGIISFKKKMLVFFSLSLFFFFLTCFSLQEHLGSLLVYLIDVDHVRKS